MIRRIFNNTGWPAFVLRFLLLVNVVSALIVLLIFPNNPRQAETAFYFLVLQLAITGLYFLLTILRSMFASGDDADRLSVPPELLEESRQRARSLRQTVATQDILLYQAEKKISDMQKFFFLGRLAGGMAHDFNNILQSIEDHSQLVLEGLDPDSEKYATLQKIMKAVEQAKKLSTQILTLGHQQPIKPARTNLGKVIEETAGMLKPTLGDQVELKIIPGKNISDIFADPIQIEQILLNLCLNARNAMPDGGELAIKTESVNSNNSLCMSFCIKYPSANPDIDYILMEVSDTGCGMDEETMDRAFDPFFSTGESGNGMGLAAVHAIVQQHDGFIDIESAEGEGTRVLIYFPVMYQ